jgi:predicted GNAT family N-acyltransferase
MLARCHPRTTPIDQTDLPAFVIDPATNLRHSFMHSRSLDHSSFVIRHLSFLTPHSRPPCEVRPITAEETISVRWPVLRSGYPRESAVFAGDDSPTTRHFGSLVDGQLTGVASIYEAPMPENPEAARPWQLRGMATLPEVRGQGCGRALLAACVAEVRRQRGTLLWCNARTEAAEFYAKHGFLKSGDIFEIPTVGPHFRMFHWLR